MAEERLQRLEDSIIHLVDSLQKDRTEKERKTRKMPNFKFKGNEQQYEFNQNLMDSLNDLRDLVEAGSVRRSSKVIEEMAGMLEKRQKLLRIADRSPGGWDTVREYLSDDLADDSADEKRIKNAESAALKKKNANKRKGPQRQQPPRYHPYNRADEDPQPRNATRTLYGATSEPLPFARNSNYGKQKGNKSQKKCFRCNRHGHLRHECIAKTRVEDE